MFINRSPGPGGTGAGSGERSMALLLWCCSLLAGGGAKHVFITFVGVCDGVAGSSDQCTVCLSTGPQGLVALVLVVEPGIWHCCFGVAVF